MNLPLKNAHTVLEPDFKEAEVFTVPSAKHGKVLERRVKYIAGAISLSPPPPPTGQHSQLSMGFMLNLHTVLPGGKPHPFRGGCIGLVAKTMNCILRQKSSKHCADVGEVSGTVRNSCLYLQAAWPSTEEGEGMMWHIKIDAILAQLLLLPPPPICSK